jgi:hypothetical protein
MKGSWTRPRQQARIALDLCPLCGVDSPYRGCKLCFECRQSMNARHRAYYAEMRAAGGVRHAPETLPALAAEMAARRRARKAAGLCIQCGTPVNKFVRCTRCRAQGAEAKVRFRARRRV